MQTTPWQTPPLGRHPPARHLKADTSHANTPGKTFQADTPQVDIPRLHSTSLTSPKVSGWYVSYWNVSLLRNCFQSKCVLFKFQCTGVINSTEGGFGQTIHCVPAFQGQELVFCRATNIPNFDFWFQIQGR